MCVQVFFCLTCHLPCGGTEAVRASWVADRRGEEVGRKAKLVLADL